MNNTPQNKTSVRLRMINIIIGSHQKIFRARQAINQTTLNLGSPGINMRKIGIHQGLNLAASQPVITRPLSYIENVSFIVVLLLIKLIKLYRRIYYMLSAVFK